MTEEQVGCRIQSSAHLHDLPGARFASPALDLGDRTTYRFGTGAEFILGKAGRRPQLSNALTEPSGKVRVRRRPDKTAIVSHPAGSDLGRPAAIRVWRAHCGTFCLRARCVRRALGALTLARGMSLYSRERELRSSKPAATSVEA
jgi:hypothetical protein